MKIQDHNTGQSYQLSPDTTLQIERTNAFFSDFGEQSLSVELPDTPLNRKLTGNPGELANSIRPNGDTSHELVDIDDGDYHVRARRCVLSAQQGKNINMSFLLEQSAFYTKIGDKQLINIFGVEKVPDVTSVDEAIAWLKSLATHDDPNFDIFPVAMTLTDTRTPNLGYRLMNVIGHYNRLYKEFWPDSYTPDSVLSSRIWLNDGQGEVYNFTNDVTLNQQKGYYMTPFIRVIYVLKRVIESLGYTLYYNESDPVISKMVFINNTIDSIVSGEGILLQDLVPDCTVSDLLNLFRYKFNMEFICNEIEKKITMLSFNSLLESAAEDITPYIASVPEIEYSENRKRTYLVPTAALSGDAAPSVIETLQKYVCPKWDVVRGGWVMEGKRGTYPVTEFILDGNAGYNSGEIDGFEQSEYKSPDKVPSFVLLNPSEGSSGNYDYRNSWVFPYIGEERALHSKLSDTGDEDAAIQERPTCDIMIMLPYSSAGSYPRGRLTAYDYVKYFESGFIIPLTDQGSLCYHGNDGLFEKYWRHRDDIARNSLNKVKIKLNLTDSFKKTLSLYQRFLIHNSPLLIESLNIVLGQPGSLAESTLYTIAPQLPISSAPHAEDYVQSDYRWQLVREFTEVNHYVEITNNRIFPTELPSAELEDEECCVQFEYAKLENNGTPYNSQFDIWSDGSIMPYGFFNENGYLFNASPDQGTKYVHIKSSFVCMRNSN